jgi:protease I
VLEGKKVTGWNGDDEAQGIFERAGAVLVSEHVVTDGNLVTADGPEAAEEFGRMILNKLAEVR